MNRTVKAGLRTGSVRIPSSKSFAHRMLICAAMAEQETTLFCDGLSDDILATVECLNALGTTIQIDRVSDREKIIRVIPIQRGHQKDKKRRDSSAETVILPVRESGSTLRFLLPLAGVLGVRAKFVLEGRLPDRPLSPYDDLLRSHGMEITASGNSLMCSGMLENGSYELPGNISSQFISGLLMSLPYLKGKSTLHILGNLESEGYVRITEGVLEQAGITFVKDDQDYVIPGEQTGVFSSAVTVEGDWSNAAFFLCMGCINEQGITVKGLTLPSLQGDSEILDILDLFGAVVSVEKQGITIRKGSCLPLMIDAAKIPDLIPVLSVLACAAVGDTKIINAGRLRLKESDRIRSTAELITSLGGSVDELPDGLMIHGKGNLRGGTVDPHHDHRLAMSAAAAACMCTDEVIVTDAECVEKSYPDFWNDYSSLTCSFNLKNRSNV